MNILFLEWKSYCVPDLTDAFMQAGHSVDVVSCQEMTDREHPDFHQKFLLLLDGKSYDMVFTFNYFPIVSKSCNELQLPYVSWTYDNPLVTLYSYTVINPCNYIFLFDYHTYAEFHKQGISTVYYLPLCANPERLCAAGSNTNYHCDLSFVGSLYTEPRQRLYERLEQLDSYSKGYLDALTFTQSRISGYFFLEDFLSENLLSALQKAYPVVPNRDGAETAAYLYSQYFLGRKSTAIERHDLLDALSKQFSLTVYTHEPLTNLPDAKYGGKIDYYDTMPSVFHQSRINLNITLKTIQTGIPLRAWDILGCSGFLLSNYQEELCTYFTPGEDFIYYESIDDAIEKVSYYLSHEKERAEIAQNGFLKLKESHTFHHRVQSMFDMIGNS